MYWGMLMLWIEFSEGDWIWKQETRCHGLRDPL